MHATGIETTGPPPAADPAEPPPPASLARRLVPWLIGALYLLGAIAVTWNFWQDPATRLPGTYTKGNWDVVLIAWYLRYSAIAVSHGHLPALVSGALNWPRGINMMWNTSLLLPGVILAPVTLAFGPTVSMTVLMTVGFAGSAGAMCFVLRRWGASIGAAAVGGALYGFSPAIRMAAVDHYHLQFAVLPPLIIHLALRLITGRGRPVLTGALLGLLIAAQLLIAEEMLVLTAVAGLVILVVLLASRPGAFRPGAIKPRLGGLAAGLATAAAVTTVLTAKALLAQFTGPLAETGTPWQMARYGSQPADLVTAPDSMLLHGPRFTVFLHNTGQFRAEYFAYLGLPLLIALVAATIWCWRDLRVRLAAVCWIALELLSLGDHPVHLGGWQIPTSLLPWRWLDRLPLFVETTPDRFSILADGGAAVVLAFAINRAWLALSARRTQAGWRRPGWRIVVPVATALVLVPVIPRPVVTISTIPPPAGWNTVVSGLRLPAGAGVLVAPNGPAMEWQALSGQDISLVGGYCIVATLTGQAGVCGRSPTMTADEFQTLSRLTGLAHDRAHGPSRAVLASALLSWRLSAIISTDGSSSRLAQYLTRCLGPPAVSADGIVGWRIDRSTVRNLCPPANHAG